MNGLSNNKLSDRREKYLSTGSSSELSESSWSATSNEKWDLLITKRQQQTQNNNEKSSQPPQGEKRKQDQNKIEKLMSVTSTIGENPIETNEAKPVTRRRAESDFHGSNTVSGGSKKHLYLDSTSSAMTKARAYSTLGPEGTFNHYRGRGDVTFAVPSPHTGIAHFVSPRGAPSDKPVCPAREKCVTADLTHWMMYSHKLSDSAIEREREVAAKRQLEMELEMQILSSRSYSATGRRNIDEIETNGRTNSLNVVGGPVQLRNGSFIAGLADPLLSILKKNQTGINVKQLAKDVQKSTFKDKNNNSGNNGGNGANDISRVDGDQFYAELKKGAGKLEKVHKKLLKGSNSRKGGSLGRDRSESNTSTSSSAATGRDSITILPNSSRSAINSNHNSLTTGSGIVPVDISSEHFFQVMSRGSALLIKHVPNQKKNNDNNKNDKNKNNDDDVKVEELSGGGKDGEKGSDGGGGDGEGGGGTSESKRNSKPNMPLLRLSSIHLQGTSALLQKSFRSADAEVFKQQQGQGENTDDSSQRGPGTSANSTTTVVTMTSPSSPEINNCAVEDAPSGSSEVRTISTARTSVQLKKKSSPTKKKKKKKSSSSVGKSGIIMSPSSSSGGGSAHAHQRVQSPKVMTSATSAAVLSSSATVILAGYGAKKKKKKAKQMNSSRSVVEDQKTTSRPIQVPIKFADSADAAKKLKEKMSVKSNKRKKNGSSGAARGVSASSHHRKKESFSTLPKNFSVKVTAETSFQKRSRSYYYTMTPEDELAYREFAAQFEERDDYYEESP